jgi:ABC-type dipeptide/oligopeptide/nickel transport system ATPase subunit
VKIKTLSLTDFRAFPGPTPTTFDLDGKNLLVYGENGSGKSSVFHALKGIFHPTSHSIEPFRNQFTQPNAQPCSVEVIFTDGTSAIWTGKIRKVVPEIKKADVVGASLRVAVLDYRSILDTNYLHNFDGKGYLTAADNASKQIAPRRINLFKIAIKSLLGGFLVTPQSGAVTQTTIAKLWTEVELQTQFIGENPNSTPQKVNNASLAFNQGMNTALQQLNSFLQPMLDAMGYPDLVVNALNFGGLTAVHNRLRNKRYFDGQSLWLDVQFRSKSLTEPQNFLNEARLSALGLAIYLAGRLALVQSAPQDALKLLVLDDVLIGLDQSNRIPVLDLLESRFKDWQIVLLTHDRLWFETARARAQLTDNWNIVELFANNESDASYRPTVAKRESDVVEDYLSRATAHLGNSDWRASAVYARSAFEMWLKIQCALHAIPIQFNLEPRKVDSNVYFNAIEKWADNNTAKPAFSGVLKVLALYRDTVFNPGSHSYPTSMSGGEQRAAIAAMRFVNNAAKHGANSLQLAEHLITKPNASPEELALAAGFLRIAFMRRLRELAKKKLLVLPFTMEPHEIPPTDLWNAMNALGWPLKRNNWVANINANSQVLINAWTWPTLLGMTAAQLQTAMNAMQQH